MITVAIDKRYNIVTASEAIDRHHDGDRYRELKDGHPYIGRPLRLHKSPRGTMKPHFEYEPRWEDA